MLFISPVRSRFQQGPSRLTPRAPSFKPSRALPHTLRRAVQVPGILTPVLTLVRTRAASRSARFPSSPSVLRKGLLFPPGFHPYATRALNSIISCTHRFRLGLVSQWTQGLQASAEGSITASPASSPRPQPSKTHSRLCPPAGLRMTMSDP